MWSKAAYLGVRNASPMLEQALCQQNHSAKTLNCAILALRAAACNQAPLNPRACALLILAVAGLAEGVVTNLMGAHYNITVIHDPPGVDVGLNDDAILNSSKWTGSVARLTTTF